MFPPEEEYSVEGKYTLSPLSRSCPSPLLQYPKSSSRKEIEIALNQKVIECQMNCAGYTDLSTRLLEFFSNLMQVNILPPPPKTICLSSFLSSSSPGHNSSMLLLFMILEFANKTMDSGNWNAEYSQVTKAFFFLFLLFPKTFLLKRLIKKLQSLLYQWK